MAGFLLVLMGMFLFLGAGSTLLRAGEPVAPSHSFQLGSYTEVKLDGNDSSTSQLQVGMQAFVTPDSFQEGFAASIDAHSLLHRLPPITVVPVVKNAPKTSSKPPVADRLWVITAITPTTITVAFQ